MSARPVRLEDVRRAWRLSVGLAVAGGIAVLAVALVAGLPLALALAAAAPALALGALSGGFGLAPRVSAPCTRLGVRRVRAAKPPSAPLRIPQTR